jgi:hypothetical protein
MERHFPNANDTHRLVFMVGRKRGGSEIWEKGGMASRTDRGHHLDWPLYSAVLVMASLATHC